VKDKIVFGEINLSLLTKYLKQISTVDEQLIFIIDRRGQVIADQEGVFTAQQLNMRNLLLVREGMEDSESQIRNFKFQNRSVMGSLVKTPLLDWYVLIMIPVDVVYKPVFTAVNISLVVFLFTLVAGVTFAITFARRLAQRFERLAAHARSMAEGNYIVNWPEVNITEFHELSNDLQYMAGAIREREKYNRMLFADSPVPLVVIEPETAEISDCNDAVLRLYGLKNRKGFIGKSILGFSAGVQEDGIVSRERASEYGKQCLKEGHVSFEWVNQKSDGKLWYCEIDMTQFRYGEKILMQFSIKDITQQKFDTEELRRLEDQLKHAQRMESIGTLAGGIAHDFNNILFPMLGYTEMLIGDVESDSFIGKSLEEIMTGILRARDLVKQILAFSRQTDHEYIPVDCDMILKEVLKLSRSTLPATIELKQNIGKNCGKVMADPTQVHQIVMNLVTNAFHSMEKNGGILSVSLSVQNKPPGMSLNNNDSIKSYICITVSDTGSGMDENTIQRIFDPYFTTKEQGKGTGLGLSVVHGIVKTYKGHIEVKSDPEKGTEFKVYLPRIDKDDRTPLPDITKGNDRHGNERILLVDDEEPVLKMFRKILETLGYQVYCTQNSLHALEIFTSRPDTFDLIITDMTMPGFTGDKLAVELKKVKPDIPVILCTGFSENVTEEKKSQFGINKVLLKPIIKHDLASAIREVLGN